MTISPMSAFLENIRRAALRRDEAGWSDGQLLDAYVRGREEAVFAALVHRHGPMVWGVCRRVLDNEGDAEDAFQATFLVLVRKAASIKPREKVANWLYGVAQKTAVKARAMAVKRKRREKQVKEMPEAAVVEQTNSDDLLPLLDRELSRLPDKYRSALILCELEGRSYKEAAGQLGCPEGTLAARLTRGRAMLAKRLARHGLTVTGAALATVFAPNAPAGAPASVVSATIKAAGLFAAGQAAAMGAIAPSVVALTEGVLKTMLLSKLKIATAVLLTAAVVSGAAGLAYQTQAREETSKTETTAAAPAKARTEENILQNGGIEKGEDSPAHWSQGAEIAGVEYIWDKEHGKRGKASLCLHKTAQRYFPIAQWYQIVDRKGDKPALRVSAQVKAEGVTKAIVDVLFLDEQGDAIEHRWVSYIGAKNANDPPVSHDWKEYTGRVAIPATTKKLQVALQIYGPGKVWFDEVRAQYTDQPTEKGTKGRESRSTSSVSAEGVAKRDQQELQGIWEVISVVQEGKQVEKIFYDNNVWVFDGGRIRGIGGGPPTYTLNSSQSPKTIDITRKSRISNTKYGPVVTDLGIFELKGDELKIAMCENKYGRPKDFESTAENHVIITVLKRVRLGK